MKTILAAALIALAPVAALAGTTATTSATLEGKRISITSYMPSCPAITGILFVFHGVGRSSYPTGASRLADAQCLHVYAPEFPSAQYSSATYQMGGVKANGPTTGRTVDMVDDLIAWGVKRSGNLPVYLFGHSAGAQFTSRIAAYAPQDRAARYIVANPSTWVLPSATERAPYGFDMTADGKLDVTEADLLRRYVEAPVTVYLGSEDSKRDSDLATGAAAERQGRNRLERGRNTYEHARQMAQANGWRFGWTLVVADGVGHSGSGMLRAPEMADAMTTPAPQCACAK